jgi:hypothetical protein
VGSRRHIGCHPEGLNFPVTTIASSSSRSDPSNERVGPEMFAAYGILVSGDLRQTWSSSARVRAKQSDPVGPVWYSNAIDCDDSTK